MAKIVLNDLTNTYNPTVINENFSRIEAEFQDKVLYRDNPFGEANTLESDIDANSKSIYNVDNLSITGTLSANGVNIDGINSALVWRGPWQGGLSYAISDAVTHLGTSYIAIQPNTGSTPPSANWDILAQKGEIGAGVVPPPGGITIPNFSIDTTTPNDRVEFTDTSPAGWNLTSGSCYVQFEVVSNNYYAANPGGHWAVVARCDTDVIATVVRGAGAAVGNLTGAPEGTQTNPGAQVETWAGGLLPVTDRFLIPNAASPSNKALLDNIRYRFIIESVYTEAATRHIRLVCLRENIAKAAYDLEFDTGYVLDNNEYADMTKHGLVFAQVFEDNLVPWSLAFSNVRVVWGPAPTQDSASIDRLSRYGASLDGDLIFTAARRIHAPSNAGPSLLNSLTVQSGTLNTATTLVVKPNGTSTTSNLLFSNNSSSTTTYQAISYGMTGVEGIIETFGFTAAVPVFGINIGIGNRIVSVLPTGMVLTGDLAFSGNARRITGPANAGPSLVNSLTVQSSTANTATTLVVKPNGSSTNAGILYSNNSDSSTVYGAASYGMVGVDSIIETIGLATTTPKVGINIGVGNRVATFKASSINFLGGTRDYGALINYNAGLSNFGGANATTHNTTNTLNIDSICTPGVIASFMSATPTNTQVESILRPLYCMFSELIADLRAKKAI